MAGGLRGAGVHPWRSVHEPQEPGQLRAGPSCPGTAARRVVGTHRAGCGVRGRTGAAVAGRAAADRCIASRWHAALPCPPLPQGEPLIVQIGWAATCVMFSFSLSLVVWGRSGM